MNDDEHLHAPLEPTQPTRSAARKWLVGLALLVVVAVALYYPVGMLLTHAIDDDPDFAAGTAERLPDGASAAVAAAAALIEREVDRHRWTANDPFFMPTAALDNMPNFQQGIVSALSRFAIEMSDQIGRVRGASQIDPDLDKAAGLLKYPGTVWIFDLSTSFAPTASSEAQYRAARRALLSYNDRLAAGDAMFERRADNLQAALERIAADIGSASAVIETHVAENAGWFVDLTADDIFYRTKGRLYGYFLLLRGLAADFANVVAERDIAAIWDDMQANFRAGATLQPWVVANGRPDAQFVPSHLSAQGFYLLRARTRLKEIFNILLK